MELSSDTPSESERGLQVLVVEDDEDVAREIGDLLAETGHTVALASTARDVMRWIHNQPFDLIVSDVRLPDIDGLELFRRLRTEAPWTEVVLMSAYGTVSQAVEAMREHARYYLLKPFAPEELLRVVGEVSAQAPLHRAMRGAEGSDVSGPAGLVGTSPAMRRVYDRIAAVATSDAAVLIHGESGTGKELTARAIWEQSPRAGQPFIALNCAALPETLFEAELFGHERGAFTGADRRREGRFEAARGGTLLLDEVSEMNRGTQAKLLRVIQEGSVQRLGSNREVSVDVRVLAATNANLRERVREGTFREDLYYRLKTFELHLPPLRERRSDLPALIAHFLARHGGGNRCEISPTAWAALHAYMYPGNIRELEHVVKHGILFSRGGIIELEHLPEELAAAVPSLQSATGGEHVASLAAAVGQFERTYLAQVLASQGGSRTRTAALLGISRKSLWEKLKRHGLDTVTKPSSLPPPDD